MKSEPKQQHPSETTNLLCLPSPHSTDRPIRQGYSSNGVGIGQSINTSDTSTDGHDDEEIPFVRPESNSPQTKVPQKQRCKKLQPFSDSIGRGRAILILFCACIFSVSILSLLSFKEQQREIDVHTSSMHQIQAQPFSQKHPVTDLGVAGLARPFESSPPHHVFRRLGTSSDSEHWRPLPTSAWYQNLLLTHGEPTNLNRAYAIPYVIDVTGPIPGLTLHSSFLVTTSKVIQLANNAQFGLTLGAESYIHDDKKERYSHQYSIDSPTELGVTLHWVSTLA